jgi:VWFA-related protein
LIELILTLPPERIWRYILVLAGGRVRASLRISLFSLVLAALALLALISTAQTLAPEEVRISSSPCRPQSRILRTESRLVRLEVVVRDSRGRAVSGLTKDDFAVFDSGHRRDIAQFSVQTSNAAAAYPSKTANTPPAASRKSGTLEQTPGSGRWIGLFFDDINTSPGDLGRAKIAAKRFIIEAAQSGDRIAVFTTSGGQILQFTSNGAAVIKSMTALQSHPRMERAGLKACPRITAYEAYQITHNDPITMQAKLVEACQCDPEGTCDPNFVSRVGPSGLLNPSRREDGLAPLIANVRQQAQATWDQARLVSQATLDAVRAAVDRLSQMRGKRVLLLASSGFFSGDLGGQEDEITNAALRAGVVINSLDSKGLYAEPPGRPLNESGQAPTPPDLTMMYEARSLGDTLQSEDAAMARFAESTGGLLFRNNNDLDFGFRELGLVPAYAYELGFQPDEDGKYHKIKVEVQNAKYDFIQARPGYFAPTKEAQEQATQPTPEEQIDAEVRGSNERSDFPLTVREKSATATSGAHELSVETHMDIQKLPFKEENGRRVDMLTFVAALFDSGGKMIAGKEAQMQFALKPETFARFSKTGINGGLSLAAPPGAYRLRVVVEEALAGQISATTQNIHIQ